MLDGCTRRLRCIPGLLEQVTANPDTRPGRAATPALVRCLHRIRLDESSSGPTPAIMGDMFPPVFKRSSTIRRRSRHSRPTRPVLLAILCKVPGSRQGLARRMLACKPDRVVSVCVIRRRSRTGVDPQVPTDDRLPRCGRTQTVPWTIDEAPHSRCSRSRYSGRRTSANMERTVRRAAGRPTAALRCLSSFCKE